MRYDANKHHRRSIRLKGYDYTQAGAYFITLVSWQRECLFGEIRSGEISLNALGSLVDNEWRRLGKRFERVVVDELIVMPNHVHGILVIAAEDLVGAGGVGARQEGTDKVGEYPFASPLRGVRGSACGVIPGSLGAIVGAYKSTTARLINGLRRTPGAPVWQRNFYEHIIRDESEWEAIRVYIHNNPFEWEADNENPARSEASE
ncbi:MAG TPA: hypothetical protein VI703_04915 [Anaerolineales bacterium]|nr:hypothetical protein [Anaerolineales bacterium]